VIGLNFHDVVKIYHGVIMTLEKRVVKLERTGRREHDEYDLHALASIIRSALIGRPDVLMEVSELISEGHVALALEILRPYLNAADKSLFEEYGFEPPAWPTEETDTAP
jgi:hypothetical protein